MRKQAWIECFFDSRERSQSRRCLNYHIEIGHKDSKFHFLDQDLMTALLFTILIKSNWILMQEKCPLHRNEVESVMTIKK